MNEEVIMNEVIVGNGVAIEPMWNPIGGGCPIGFGALCAGLACGGGCLGAGCGGLC